MSAIAFPSIWIPRRSIKDRLNSLTEWFSDQKIQRGSDGKIRRGTDGKIKRYSTGSEPCCCSPPPPPPGQCQYCVSTSLTRTVTFSGVSLCGCFPSTGTEVFGTLDGTYTVTMSPSGPFDLCLWEYNGTNVIIKLWDSVGCTGVSFGSYNNFQVALDYDGTNWSLQAATTSTPGSGDNPAFYFFQSTIADAGYCANSIAFTNTNGACSRTLGIAGNGGSATVSA